MTFLRQEDVPDHPQLLEMARLLEAEDMQLQAVGYPSAFEVSDTPPTRSNEWHQFAFHNPLDIALQTQLGVCLAHAWHWHGARRPS